MLLLQKPLCNGPLSTGGNGYEDMTVYNLLRCANTRNETETFLLVSSSVSCNQLLWFEFG